MSDILRSGTGNGFNFEIGSALFVATTVEVNTKLQKIYAALAIYTITPGADARGPICDKTITTHAVTFSDAAVDAKPFRYLLIGI